MADGLLTELRAGMRETRRYLLSHHESDEWNRCYTARVPFDGRPVRLCARCSGIYPGIAVGLLASLHGIVPVTPLLVAVLPAFALADWTVTTLTDRNGSNQTRTVTGALLGVGYGIGLVGLTDPATRVSVLLVGAGYAAMAGGLLYWHLRRAVR
jgi:uncharacterized membrane protein